MRACFGCRIWNLDAFRVMAIDAERRNCHLTDGQLQPFDVILYTPDEEMERYLGIYPEG